MSVNTRRALSLVFYAAGGWADLVAWFVKTEHLATIDGVREVAICGLLLWTVGVAFMVSFFAPRKQQDAAGQRAGGAGRRS